VGGIGATTLVDVRTTLAGFFAADLLQKQQSVIND
jgi:hypothetical protein